MRRILYNLDDNEYDTPSYWIERAIAKKVNIPWLEFAIRKGFYVPKKDDAIKQVTDKPLSDKERESMIKIIHALAKNGYKYPNHGTLAEIVRDFETNNNGVSENTLIKYLDMFDSL